ncbi:MAG: hypothetical protein CMO81_06035 [Waddliaceae bacterium]|nr:hypothetical protein [Waddliaceae bacterium]
MEVKTHSPFAEQFEQKRKACDSYPLDQSIANSWSKIAPFWPLKNLIAVNPLAGFENLSFEDALKEGNAYFQQKDIPSEMEAINRESLKWLQVFFDEGQATIPMPIREQGFLQSTLSLLRYDTQIHQNDNKKIYWLETLPTSAEEIIREAFLFLGICSSDQELFLTLMLSTLPGWAAYIQYKINWSNQEQELSFNPVSHSDYLAFRLILTSLIWPEAKDLLTWHKKLRENIEIDATYQKILEHESQHQKQLLSNLNKENADKLREKTDAQLVFCIDVRSEPFRRALEAEGNYETFGFAGFFGMPISVTDLVTGESHDSCPVLIKPNYQVSESPVCSSKSAQNGQRRVQRIKKLYQSLKYTFTTPFSLVETMGVASGLWMALKCLSPKYATAIESRVRKLIQSDYMLSPNIDQIPLDQQVKLSAQALKSMGLNKKFAPLVVFCGHGSSTQNNAYATSLDCGACGGHHGAPNARVLAKILNSKPVRKALKKEGIVIPKDTFFLAAEHNTTTDEVEIYEEELSPAHTAHITFLKEDLEKARNTNTTWRNQTLGITAKPEKAKNLSLLRSQDWAQIRPEWGLAKNASFIVGPRWLTKGKNLGGRSFLHSYEWQEDLDGSILASILTAPMVVAQWINAQYLFSTLDNIAFGGGSKTTQNIVGKLGVMQGNASDLMSGLPLQSVYKNDLEAYHEPNRLNVLIHAPQSRIEQIIQEQSILQKLFGNGWVTLIAYPPSTNEAFILKRDFTWSKLH